jgi:AcrR family transcriptional regulator
MSPRPYRSKVRGEAAGETRARIVTAAAELLVTNPYAPFSRESVARKAGVTRLTVYNQFEALYQRNERRRRLLCVIADRLVRGPREKMNTRTLRGGAW